MKSSKDFSDFSPEQIQKILPRLNRSELLQLEAYLERKKHDDIVERVSLRIIRKKNGIDDAGPMYWLRHCTRTENYHWQSQGRPDPKEPFPYKPYASNEWDYLDQLMQLFLTRRTLYVPKSREMMTSWLAVGYATWSCQFIPNTQIVAQSEKDDKAQGLVKYANILYDNQPSWLKARNSLKRGQIGTKHSIEWANGSEFIAVPQGIRQVASYHPTIYINDESAHQPEWEETLNVVRPVAKQIICISSAAEGRFMDLCQR